MQRRILGILTAISVGTMMGFGGFTFFYARGFSYLLDDPRACRNCHVMREQFDGWNRSTHHTVATCNSCHTPKNILGKYATKAINGWNHSAAFTTGRFEVPIHIHSFNARIAQENCVRCHGELTIRMRAFAFPDEMDCIRCHGNVGHNNRY